MGDWLPNLPIVGVALLVVGVLMLGGALLLCLGKVKPGPRWGYSWVGRSLEAFGFILLGLESLGVLTFSELFLAAPILAGFAVELMSEERVPQPAKRSLHRRVTDAFGTIIDWICRWARRIS